MGICEIEYYSPLTVNLSVDLYSIRFDNIEPFGTCVAFNYKFLIEGFGKVTGDKIIIGTSGLSITKPLNDEPATVRVERVGTMWYSRRYGLVKDSFTEEWKPVEFTLKQEFKESDTVTLQSATLSD
jgi:hypothetical protein